MFATSYSQLVIKDASGTEKIIYDVSGLQQFGIAATLLFVLLILCVVIVGIVIEFIKIHIKTRHTGFCKGRR